MNASDVPDITVRLRHLISIKGRNFRSGFGEIDATTGVFFAISIVDPEDVGYVFVSTTCDHVNNPEWDAIHISNVPQWMLASKAAVFTFFLVHQHTNTILFEIDVNFSGLVIFDQELHNSHVSTESANEVYFQFGASYYAPASYLSRESCVNCILPRPTFRVNLKLSYDFETLQRLIVNMHISQTQQTSIKSAEDSVRVLRHFLSPLLDNDAKREYLLCEISFLKLRLRSEEHALNKAHDQLKLVSQKLRMAEKKLGVLAQSATAVTDRVCLISKLLTAKRLCLAAVADVLATRTSQLIHEMLTIICPELAFHGPKDAAPFSKAYVSEDSPEISNALVHPGDSTPPAHQQLCLNNGLLNSQPPRSGSDPVESFHELRLTSSTTTTSSSSSTTGLLLVESNNSCMAFTLGTVALLLRLLSAILNQPLRYTLDVTEGLSRSKVTDFLFPDPTENDQRFPLYLPRSSLLPAYKHAVFLLNRNLSSLRALCGLSTPNEEATVWNVITLLQHCISNCRQLHLT